MTLASLTVAAFLRLVSGDATDGYLEIWARGPARCTCECAPVVSVLVTDERIVIGVSRVGDEVVIERRAWMPALAWGAYEGTLRRDKAMFLADRTDVEIAVDSFDRHEVTYQELVDAMDLAHRAGFTDVAFLDSADLEGLPPP